MASMRDLIDAENVSGTARLAETMLLDVALARDRRTALETVAAPFGNRVTRADSEVPGPLRTR